jgi:hypothetical protein
MALSHVGGQSVYYNVRDAYPLRPVADFLPAIYP